jgi:apolipoprotein N-acyltransferase
MGRLLAPLAGVVGLLMLVVGLVWAEIDVATMGGMGLVGLGVLVLIGAVLLAAASEALTHVARRHRPAGHPAARRR